MFPAGAPFLSSFNFVDVVWFQRYGGSGGGGEEREMYVDVKPVELVGTDKITKKQRYYVVQWRDDELVKGR